MEGLEPVVLMKDSFHYHCWYYVNIVLDTSGQKILVWKDQIAKDFLLNNFLWGDKNRVTIWGMKISS